jgi:site-specific recombinase XerD
MKSFTGFLEGTGKSIQTIESYVRDLRTFEDYLKERFGPDPEVQAALSLKALSTEDLDRYQEFLKVKGLKTNTRRRKVLTVRRLFAYLTKRNRLQVNVSLNLPAPYKVERIPQTLAVAELLEKIRALPSANSIEARNRALLWVLLETGCAVSEVPMLKFEDFSTEGNQAVVAVTARGGERRIPVSADLLDCVRTLQGWRPEQKHLFMGFNKFGPLSSPITPRGIELLVRVYAKRLGIEALTPRMIRHSVVVEWLRSGVEQDEAQRRLGLRSDYAFRVYRPLVRGVQNGGA